MFDAQGSNQVGHFGNVCKERRFGSSPRLQEPNQDAIHLDPSSAIQQNGTQQQFPRIVAKQFLQQAQR
jgi:hypothetical protein